MDNAQRLELKNQALLEKVSSLTTNYENQIADLRVEVTMLMNELQNARAELASAAERLDAAEGTSSEDPDAVSEEAPAEEQG